MLIASYPLYAVILCFSARPSQEREVIELQEFAVSRGFDGAIQLWDLPYWKRKQSASLFGYDPCIASPLSVRWVSDSQSDQCTIKFGNTSDAVLVCMMMHCTLMLW